jgi:hydrogenase/urease accessory protein HupE
MIARLALPFAALFTFTDPAVAHLLPAQTATMNIVGDTAYFVVSVPVSALAGIDDDGSGGASALEISRHSREIAQQFNRRFHVAADGAPGTPLMTMAWPPQTEGTPADSPYVVVLHSVRFTAPPQQPSVSTDLFGTRSGEAQMTMTAKHDKRENTAEVAILRPGAADHIFFRGGLATFVDFVRVGIEHILSGPDHLLYLLTIIVAAAGWRYWLGVVTSFTIAHSITLTLAALGVVRVSPAIVEPGIAASIILMAVLNLWRGGAGSRAETRTRIGIVFACGLLHGLGFASAIGAMAADGTHRLATLAGFNVGIELGQFAFLGAVLLLTALGSRLLAAPRTFALPKLASMTAAMLGAVMLMGRVLPVLPSVG